jgi:hypothetical protein
MFYVTKEFNEMRYTRIIFHLNFRRKYASQFDHNNALQLTLAYSEQVGLSGNASDLYRRVQDPTVTTEVSVDVSITQGRSRDIILNYVKIASFHIPYSSSLLSPAIRRCMI